VGSAAGVNREQAPPGPTEALIDPAHPAPLEYALPVLARLATAWETALLFFLILAFLIPLGVYCLVLALVNRRYRPLMVRGVWDCVGLVFAASGFLLVVAPAALKILYAKAIGEIPLDEQPFERAVSSVWLQWWGITLLYFLLLVAGTGVLFWWRSSKTLIYNVDAERFDGVLQQTLTRLGFDVSRSGNQLGLSRAPAVTAEIVDLNQTDGVVTQASAPASGEALLIVEPFTAMGNVTLHWFTENPRLRDETEDALEKNLGTARLYDNPAGTWFLGIAGAIFSIIFVLALIIVLGLYLPPRR
jgi:hypothetical protein